MKIKIIANNCQWASWPEKLQAIKDWYAPKINIEFEISHVSFTDIPFKFYGGADVISGGNDVQGVDYDWYDEHISPLGIGSDIVMFVMSLADWKGHNARGWRNDASVGPIELQIGTDENESIIWPNFPALNGFFQLARHEIMHALFFMSGQRDTTHYWWALGQLENARDSLKIPENYSAPIVQRALVYLKKLVLQLLEDIKTLPPDNSIYTPPEPVKPVPKTNSQILYETALSCIGTDASPNDVAPDEFGCAETVNAIYKKAFGSEIGGTVSTHLLYQSLLAHPNFKQVSVPTPGNIIISPTGSGGNNNITHGHVGYVGKDGKVMSNESSSGNFQENYTLESWRARYEKLGGYPVLFFERL